MDLALRVLGWGLIGIGLAILLLKLLGVIHSPPESLVNDFITSGLLILLGRLEERTSHIRNLSSDISELREGFSKLDSKFDLIWSDFKKRKEL